jgi:hypothetical protein
MIDETGYGNEPVNPFSKRGIRTAVMSSLEAGKWLWTSKIGGNKSGSPVHRITMLGWILRYGMKNGMCSPRRRKTVKIDEMVTAWIEAVVGMCQAHDKDEYDAHDAKADELLGPLLTAPVAQVREFYANLSEAMKADKRVPMLVWMGFEAWGEVAVKGAQDQGVIRLKNKLAQEIADLVEEPIRDQIPKAVARALRWRDPETLQSVKETLESGVKPKLRGRESCLFLEAGRGKNKVSVML